MCVSVCVSVCVSQCVCLGVCVSVCVCGVRLVSLAAMRNEAAALAAPQRQMWQKFAMIENQMFAQDGRRNERAVAAVQSGCVTFFTANAA